MIRHSGRGVGGVSPQFRAENFWVVPFLFSFSSQANTEAAKGVELHRSTFDSKPEGLQKPHRLLEGRSLDAGKGRGRGSLVEMLEIRVYGWPEGVSIIHKVRPPNTA